jgi:hypothetical protein
MIISNEYVPNGCQCRGRSFYRRSIEVSAITLCSPFSNILYDLLLHDRSTNLLLHDRSTNLLLHDRSTSLLLHDRSTNLLLHDRSTGVSLMVVTTRSKCPKSKE